MRSEDPGSPVRAYRRSGLGVHKRFFQDPRQFRKIGIPLVSRFKVKLLGNTGSPSRRGTAVAVSLRTNGSLSETSLDSLMSSLLF